MKTCKSMKNDAKKAHKKEPLPPPPSPVLLTKDWQSKRTERRAKICEKEEVDPRWYPHWGKEQCREQVQNEQKYAKREPDPPMGTPF